MQFCPKCGSILIQKKKRFACPKCGYVSREKVKLTSSEKVENGNKIDVLHEKDSNVWPVVSATCPECGHDQAFFWSAQMRAADEAETRFFRCTKCKHTWREYS
jgi:DNA-directed RNA polymerase subunit M